MNDEKVFKSIFACIKENMYIGNTLIVIEGERIKYDQFYRNIRAHYFDTSILVFNCGDLRKDDDDFYDLVEKNQPRVRMRDLLESASIDELKTIITEERKLLVINDAQLVNNIGNALWLIAQNFMKLQVIAVFSSVLDMDRELHLTLRKPNMVYFHLP